MKEDKTPSPSTAPTPSMQKAADMTPPQMPVKRGWLARLLALLRGVK